MGVNLFYTMVTAVGCLLLLVALAFLGPVLFTSSPISDFVVDYYRCYINISYLDVEGIFLQSIFNPEYLLFFFGNFSLVVFLFALVIHL